jgi:hypothetical protein
MILFLLPKKENIMKSLFVRLSIFLVVTLLISSCGPSPEQIATMTASAWTATPKPTSTPTPTLTPTPIPYDLTVSVVDEAGVPIVGASIVFPESGNGEVVVADAAGQFTWSNLPGAAATLKISAQGYLSSEQSDTLERGPSEISVVMKRDPYGLLPSTACAPGEKLLFMEDFQDGQTDIKHWGSTGRSPVPLGFAPDEAGNTVLIHDMTTPNNDMSTAWKNDPEGAPIEFGNAAWRMRFMLTKETEWSLGWNSAGPNEFGGITTSDSGYSIMFNTSRHIIVLRGISDANGQGVYNLGKTGLVDKVLILKPNVWHYLEISTYQGHVQVWLDGAGIVDVQDDMPLPPGGFNIQGGKSGILYYDAISVCGLSAPFTSLPAPVPVPTTTP